jgi:transcriptional regulator with XRE-family HTH domain
MLSNCYQDYNPVAGAIQEDYNPDVPRPRKLTKTDPEFLTAVSNALQAYKKSRGPTYSNSSLAVDLGVEESTIAKYIRREYPIMGEVLTRACVELGVSFSYKGHTISASSFPATTAAAASPRPTTQLEFLFDAEYSAEKNSWRMTQRRAEPMEFTLRIKIAG